MKQITLKVKVGDKTRLAKAAESRKSLNAMGIDHERAGSKVTITQKAPLGVSFVFGHPPIAPFSKEFHLSTEHAVNVFPNEAKTKK
jgi:Fe2+ transport system protein FeoA